MEEKDFQNPSPKRQRTELPHADRMSIEVQENLSPQIDLQHPDARGTDSKSTGHESVGEHVETNDMLDALMQHVEAESQPRVVASSEESTGAQSPTKHLHLETLQASNVGAEQPMSENSIPKAPYPSAEVMPHLRAGDELSTAIVNHANGTKIEDATMDGEPQPYDTDSAMAEAAAQVDGIPVSDSAQAMDGTAGAEWEVDSSPYESSSESSDETSSDSSDDEQEDGDYALLNPEEQARILMHGEGGSDDEGDKSTSRGAGSGLKTANERAEDVPPIPEVTVTNDMPIDELGKIEAIVENNVLIMAKTSGEYRVLESGSLLCLKDRKIAGVVAETLGRVEQPLYTMKFGSEADIADRNLEKGVTIFYVVSHSSFVFTQPLKAVKGSDASNIHDEEVGADEMEFSDDEAEAEYKRQMKLKKQGRLGADGRGRGPGRGRGQRGGKFGHNSSNEADGAAYGNGSLEMNYDDVEDGEEGYTPLARPADLHQNMTASQGSSANTSHMPPPSFSDRGRGRGQGRSSRDRGRGGRGGSFRGRGASNNHHQQYQPSSPQQLQFQLPPNTGFQLPFPPPPPPMLTPHNPSYPHPFVASPISPLPQQHFNFSAAFQVAQGYGNNYQQPQQHQQVGQPPAFHNAAGIQPYGQQPQQHHQQASNYGGHWQTNQAAVAEVQRQLEEMRQAAARGGQ